MNLNQTPQPAERVGIKERISALWNSRNRMVRLVILATTGLVLNCCCVIIPLSTKAEGLVAQANAGVDAVSAPASTTAHEALRPGVTAFDHNGEGRLVCRDFSSPTFAREASLASHIRLDGGAKAGRSCQSLP